MRRIYATIPGVPANNPVSGNAMEAYREGWVKGRMDRFLGLPRMLPINWFRAEAVAYWYATGYQHGTEGRPR